MQLWRRVGSHDRHAKGAWDFNLTNPGLPVFQKTEYAAKPRLKQRRVGCRPSPGALVQAKITASRLMEGHIIPGIKGET